MEFESNAYLTWYLNKLGQKKCTNLHGSGVPAVFFDNLQLKNINPFLAPQQFEEKIAELFGHDPNNIVYTSGATGGTLLTLLTLSKNNSEFVVETPIYEPLLMQARRLGPVKKLKRTFENRWQLPIDNAKKLVTPKTAVVMITEPHNPSGVFAPRDQVLELADIAQANNAYLLINEVYLGYTPKPSFLGERPNIITVSSLSKLMGAYWSRAGWIGANPQTALKLKSAARNMDNPSGANCIAGLEFLKNAEDRIKNAIAQSKKHLNTMEQWINTSDILQWHKPEGPGFACIKPTAAIDDLEVAESLFDKKIMIVPGNFFGCPGTIRISWLAMNTSLSPYLKIIEKEIQSHVTKSIAD